MSVQPFNGTSANKHGHSRSCALRGQIISPKSKLESEQNTEGSLLLSLMYPELHTSPSKQEARNTFSLGSTTQLIYILLKDVECALHAKGPGVFFSKVLINKNFSNIQVKLFFLCEYRLNFFEKYIQSNSSPKPFCFQIK